MLLCIPSDNRTVWERNYRPRITAWQPFTAYYRPGTGDNVATSPIHKIAIQANVNQWEVQNEPDIECDTPIEALKEQSINLYSIDVEN